jgi:hypothetical protein
VSITTFFRNLFGVIPEVEVHVLHPCEEKHVVRQARTTQVGFLEKNTAFILLDKDIIYIKVEDIPVVTGPKKTICVRYKVKESKLSVIVLEASSRVKPLSEDITLCIKALGYHHDSTKNSKTEGGF